MIINKSQVQYLVVVGLNLISTCLGLVQFYVECSTVGSLQSFYILTPEGKILYIVRLNA